MQSVGVEAGEPCWRCLATDSPGSDGRVLAREVRLPDGRWLLIQTLATDITGRKRAEEALRERAAQLERLASQDSLTGLLNRRAWLAQAQRILHRAAHAAESAGILMVDIDRFKQVNDTWGHAAGDHVIVEVGRRLVSQCRPDDLVGRWGGEEFIVLLRPPVEQLGEIAERLVRAVQRQPIAVPGEARMLPVTISVGAATWDPQSDPRPSLDRIIAEADRRLLAAKSRGRALAVSAAV